MGDAPARRLLVHNNDSFLNLVRDLGELTESGEPPPASGGAGFEALSRANLEHDATVVGDSLMDQSTSGAGARRDSACTLGSVHAPRRWNDLHF